MNILCEFCTFSVTEGNEIWHSFQITTPTRKLTQDMNFRHSKIIRHFGPENPQIWTQKDTNFGHSKIIRHFRPENPQNPTQKDTTFEKIHSLTPVKTSTNKESIRFSRISYYLHLYSNALINPTNTNQLTTLGTPSNKNFIFCRPIVIHLDSSTLAQDAVLNCCKRPAHNLLSTSYFSETNLILCSILVQIHSGC